MTRDELITAMRNHARLTRKTAGELADIVLAEVLTQVTPVIEREWTGGEVLKRIRSLKSNPKP